MAKNSTATVPSPDAVFVWITFTIEQDHIERGAFPELRAQKAAIQHGSSSLHYMTAHSVRPVLADAKARRDETRKGMRHAYNAFVGSLEKAIKEAAERPAVFEAPEPARTYKSEYFEEWRGTKEQLTGMGIKLAGPWPGEEGGKQRSAKAYDSKGRVVRITRYSRTWSHLFEARIEIPERERQGAKDDEDRAKRRAKAELELAAIPKDEDEFKFKLIEDIRLWMSVVVKAKPVEYHGFCLTEESVEDILLSCDAVAEAIMQADVHFDSERQHNALLKYQQQIAATDVPFQQALSQLTTIRPEIVGGES